MGIIRWLINAFLGSSKKAPSSNKRSAQPKAKINVLIKQAEEAASALNDSLRIANQSTEFNTRESELKKARDKLAELKNMSIQYPFLKLDNLQAVEASIITIETETRALLSNKVANSSIKDLPDKVQPESTALQEEPPRFSEQRLSASVEQTILMCIQSCFRVVNESIEIARKSKNLETKVSRLGLARNRLKEAQRQASQFSLEIEGFDKAEAEINRIEEAIRAGTPTEIPGMQEIDVYAEYSSAARDLLKEATSLKKEKKYIEACEKLREAYTADGAENLMIEDRLRLPMYLQLAGKNDEGWDELNNLSASYTDQFSQPRIAHQMKIFLRKENNETASNPVRVILQGETTKESKTNITETWKNNQDVINGLEFCATMQLRTPLRVLLRHGEIHRDINSEPPKIAMEMWEGVWLPVIKSLEEIANDIKFFERVDAGLAQKQTIASDVGPILADNYLPFLITLRKIVELNDSIENRIKMLREYPMVGDWRTYVEKHGGIDTIIGRFFPRFIDTIPKINNATIVELSSLSLDTPNRIADATDETLLGINGIGQAKIKTIRDYCAGISNNRDDKMLENVTK